MFSKPAVFVDRDGTLIVEKGYLSDPAQVELEKGVVEGLLELRRLDHPLFVVSNQSGVGRGKFSDADARSVNAAVDHLLRRSGIEIVDWYFCPHAADDGCACRKPLPGMPLAAAADWGVALCGSYVIGDKKVDLQLADAIGGHGILLTTGHGRLDLDWARANERTVFGRLIEAAIFIRERERQRASSSSDAVAPDRSHP